MNYLEVEIKMIGVRDSKTLFNSTEKKFNELDVLKSLWQFGTLPRVLKEYKFNIIFFLEQQLEEWPTIIKSHICDDRDLGHMWYCRLNACQSHCSLLGSLRMPANLTPTSEAPKATLRPTSEALCQVTLLISSWPPGTGIGPEETPGAS